MTTETKSKEELRKQDLESVMIFSLSFDWCKDVFRSAFLNSKSVSVSHVHNCNELGRNLITAWKEFDEGRRYSRLSLGMLNYINFKEFGYDSLGITGQLEAKRNGEMSEEEISAIAGAVYTKARQMMEEFSDNYDRFVKQTGGVPDTITTTVSI